MKILILCTGNSCRSQMAPGFIQSFHPDYDVHSAGTNPASQVNPTRNNPAFSKLNIRPKIFSEVYKAIKK